MFCDLFENIANEIRTKMAMEQMESLDEVASRNEESSRCVSKIKFYIIFRYIHNFF